MEELRSNRRLNDSSIVVDALFMINIKSNKNPSYIIELKFGGDPEASGRNN